MSEIQGAEAPADNAPAIDADVEREARNLGWVGKEEFRGDPGKWRPAEEFLDRGKRILPIVLKDNERLQRNLDRVKDELKEIRQSTKEIVEFHTQAAKREYERGRREIEAKIEAATANADTNAVRAEMQNLDALNKQHIPAAPKTETTQTKPQVDPEMAAWIEKETWFNRDRALNGFAIDVYEQIQREKPGLTTAETLAETKKRTVDKFPEKFGINPARDGVVAVGTPTGGTSGRKKGKTYDDLPADAKAACDRYVKNIPNYSRDKYVKDYDWDA